MSFENLYKILDDVNTKEKKEKCCENTDNYLHDEEIIICNKCGKSINNIINSPEWRYYGSEDSKRSDPTRCGMPINPLLPKSSIGTSINNRGNYMDRISTRQRWNSMPYKERSKYKIFVDIENKCNTNNLPTIISETSKSLYSVIAETKISRGQNRRGVIAACVFNACKECKVPRSIKEISKIFDIDPKVLTKGCKNYTEIIRLNKININRYQNLDTIKVGDFIERFCYNLSINEEDKNIIKTVAEISENLNLIYDNTPPAMATGCIYLVSKLKEMDLSRKDISDKCNISEVTINKCYKKLEGNKKLNEFIQSKNNFAT
jgi:transcription initiation factor TFIIB